MSGHTVGPWEFSEDDGAVIAANGVYVGTVTSFDELPCADVEDEAAIVAECRANGFTIAAAPDLLDVAEYFVATHPADCRCPLSLKARAAVAKARGDL